jgi:hypothetical protein
MTGISFERIYSAQVVRKATHFVLKFSLNKDSCQTKVTKIVFLCPFRTLFDMKLKGLDSVHVVLVESI